MTIRVDCPHCESQYQLSPDLIGKSMRCPNPDCREVFEVRAAADETPSPEPPVPAGPSPVPTTSGAIGEFVPVFEAEPAIPLPVPEPERFVTAEVAPPVPVAPALPLDGPPILKAQPIVPAAHLPLPAPGPREVVWDGASAPPPLHAVEPRMTQRPAAVEDDIPIRTRGRRSSAPKLIFYSLLFTLLAVGAGIGGLFLYRAAQAEEQAAAEAESLYTQGKYADAQKKYEELQAEYPDSTDRPKYEFFAELAGVKAAVTAVTARENPEPALDRLRSFLAGYGDSPYAQPNTGFGSDIVQGGQLLSDALAGHADDRIAAFRRDRTQPAELDAAEKTILEGRKLIPTLEKYRDKGGLSFDEARAKFDAGEAAVVKERERLAVLAPWRGIADAPTDRTIEQFEKEMRAAGLADDAEVLALAAAAKTKLRQLVAFRPERLDADPFPRIYNAVSAVTPRVHESPNPRAADGPADVVFTVGRGVLYVLDASTGQLLWADRVSNDTRAADTPLRFRSTDGTADWLIVPTALDGETGLTARDTRTGRPLWHQPTPAAVLGRPVLVGSRLHAGLSDDRGTILQLDMLSGAVVGRGELRQPIGGGLAALRGTRSSHGFLIVPADARRVFVFEVGKTGEDLRVLAPQLVRVLATEHPKDSLRAEPVLIDPDDPAAPRRLVLIQADLPTTMKLRSFELPNLAELATPQPDGDVGLTRSAEVTVSGWSWFPPVADGERIALATDAGTFAVFGLNQPGNSDKPLFQLPGKSGHAEQSDVTRGLVVSADEDTFWVVTNGQLVRLRTAADPAGGFRVVPEPGARPVGEPIAGSQVRPRLSLGFLTVKPADGATLQGIAFDLTSGDVKWRRQLGTVAVSSPIAVPGGGAVVVDEAAGVYRLSHKPDSDQVAVEDVAAPLAAVTHPARVAAGEDASTVWVVAGDADSDGLTVRVRKVQGGQLAADARVSVPAPPAGNPAAVGDSVLIPLANGHVYRLKVDGTPPEQGPVWRGSAATPDAVCHLTAVGSGEFLATDGNNRFMRWAWEGSRATAEKAGGPWETNGPITGAAGSVVSGSTSYLLAPDTSGVSAFEMGKPTTEPVRRWKGGAGDGREGLATLIRVSGSRAVFTTGTGGVFAIDPTKDEVLWGVIQLPAVDAGGVTGLAADAASVLATYQSGHVRRIGLKNGVSTGEAERVAGAPVLQVGVTPAEQPDRVIVCYPDGTFAAVPLGPR